MSAASDGRVGPNLLPRDGRAWLVQGILTPTAADRLFDRLVERIDWRHEHARIMGRTVPLPRLTAWYGAGGYAYSGVASEPRPLLPDLAALAATAEALAGVAFDGVLANLYRDGRDSVSWHADAEPELGDDPVIASLSLGAVRRFKLRHRADRTLVVDVDLPHGSWLIMGSGVQLRWLHCLPKTARAVGPRLNLTFRRTGARLSRR